MKKHATLFFILFFQYSIVGQNYWESVNGPQGLNIKQVQFSAQGELYATCYDKTVFRSTDLGNNWAQIPAPSPGQVIERLKVGFDGTLFCQNESFSKAYYSTDQGNTWLIKPSPFQNHWLVTTGADGSYFIAGDKKALYETKNWVDIDTVIVGDELNFLPWSYFTNLGWLKDGALVVTTNYLGYLISKNNGVSWDTLPGTYASGELLPIGNDQFVFLSENDQQLYLTNKDSLEATRIVVPYPYDPPFSTEHTENVLVTSSGEIIASNGYKTYISSNGGQTWQNYSGNINNLLSQQLLPGNYILRSKWPTGSTCRSDDIGHTWSFSGYGSNRAWAHNWIFKGSEVIFCVSNSGLWRTLDGGENWEIAPGDLALPNNPAGYYNILFAPNGDLYTLQPYKLRYSSDHGNTFTDISPDQSWGSFSRVAINPLNSDIYMSGDSGILVSSDQGISWHFKSKISHRSDQPIKFHPSGTLYHVVWNYQGYSRALLRSNDTGINWELVSTSASHNLVENLQISPDGKLVAAYGQSIFVSTDNGDTWTSRTAPIQASDFHLNAEGKIFLNHINDKILYMSKNNGANWVPLPAFPSNLVDGIVDIAFDSQQRLWVNTNGDGHFRSVETTSDIKAPTAKSSAVQIFPNPAIDGFWLDCSNALIETEPTVIIRDLNNKVVGQAKISRENGFVPIHNLTPGLFIVELWVADHVNWVGKLVKL